MPTLGTRRVGLRAPVMAAQNPSDVLAVSRLLDGGGERPQGSGDTATTAIRPETFVWSPS